MKPLPVDAGRGFTGTGAGFLPTHGVTLPRRAEIGTETQQGGPCPPCRVKIETTRQGGAYPPRCVEIGTETQQGRAVPSLPRQRWKDTTGGAYPSSPRQNNDTMGRGMPPP